MSHILDGEGREFSEGSEEAKWETQIAEACNVSPARRRKLRPKSLNAWSKSWPHYWIWRNALQWHELGEEEKWWNICAIYRMSRISKLSAQYQFRKSSARRAAICGGANEMASAREVIIAEMKPDICQYYVSEMCVSSRHGGGVPWAAHVGDQSLLGPWVKVALIENEVSAWWVNQHQKWCMKCEIQSRKWNKCIIEKWSWNASNTKMRQW